MQSRNLSGKPQDLDKSSFKYSPQHKKDTSIIATHNDLEEKAVFPLVCCMLVLFEGLGLLSSSSSPFSLFPFSPFDSSIKTSNNSIPGKSFSNRAAHVDTLLYNGICIDLDSDTTLEKGQEVFMESEAAGKAISTMVRERLFLLCISHK